jgi:hypothetical protein
MHNLKIVICNYVPRFGQDLPFQTDQAFNDYVGKTFYFAARNVQSMQFAKATNIYGEQYKSLFLNKLGAEELSRGSGDRCFYPRYFTDNLLNLQLNGPPNQFYDGTWNVNIENSARAGSDLAAATIRKFQVYDGSKCIIRPSKELLPGYKAEITNLLADHFTDASLDRLKKAILFKNIDDRLKTLESLTLPLRVEAVVELSIRDGMRFVKFIENGQLITIISQMITFVLSLAEPGKPWCISTKCEKLFAAFRQQIF